MPSLLVVVEKGAVEDIVALRAELAKPNWVIQTNPGRSLEIHRPKPDAPVRVLYEKGAIEFEGEMRVELTKDIAIIVVNPGRRFEVLE